MAKPRDTKAIASAFARRTDFHDARVLGISLEPARSGRHRAAIHIDMETWLGRRSSLKRLTFTSCANAALDVDFDVLLDNAGFGNVDEPRASTDQRRIRKLLSTQMASLNIEYLDENERPSDRHPTRHKLEDLSEYVLFGLELQGGTLEVVAKNYRVTRLASG